MASRTSDPTAPPPPPAFPPVAMRPATDDRWQHDLITALLIALVTVGVFAGVSRCALINYDDDHYITIPQVQGGLTLRGIGWAWTTFHAGFYMPLTWLSLQCDSQFLGTDAAAYHLINLAFHAANAALLFWFLRRATGSRWRSALVAALFALHPLRVESVAWATERKDVLSAFFGLLALLAYWRYARTPSIRAYAAVFGCLTLSLLAKPMLVTLPLLLLLLDYWPLERTRRTTGARLVLEKIPLLFLALGASALTLYTQRMGGAVRDTHEYALSERLANAVVSYARYLGKAFWPTNLAIFYPHPPGGWSSLTVAATASILVGLTALAVWRARRQPSLIVGWLWFLGVFVPTIQLIQAGDQAMADRFSYFPAIGLGLGVVYAVPERWAVRRPAQAALGALSGAVLVALAGLTVHQIEYWRDSIAIFTRTLAVTRDNWLAENNLGSALLMSDAPPDVAIRHLHAALAIKPRYAGAHYNLALALARQGKHEEASVEYRLALEADPKYASAHVNLAVELANKGLLDVAEAHDRLAIQIQPDFVEAHNNLALLLAAEGKTEPALKEYRLALDLDPADPVVHANLGDLLAAQGDLRGAQEHYLAALKVDPANDKVQSNLGFVMLKLGDLPGALEHLRLALQINSLNVNALYNLGEVLVLGGQTQEAINCYRQAVSIQKDFAAAHWKLAEALEKVGRLDEAIEELGLAAKLRPDDAAIRASLQKALALKQAAATRP